MLGPLGLLLIRGTHNAVASNPALFTLQQKLILDQLRHTRGSPIPVERLIEALYGARYDGGPDNAAAVVRVQILRLRSRLAERGVSILTIGGAHASQGYMLDPDHLDRLEGLLAGQTTIDVMLAREARPRPD